MESTRRPSATQGRRGTALLAGVDRRGTSVAAEGAIRTDMNSHRFTSKDAFEGGVSRHLRQRAGGRRRRGGTWTVADDGIGARDHARCLDDALRDRVRPTRSAKRR